MMDRKVRRKCLKLLCLFLVATGLDMVSVHHAFALCNPKIYYPSNKTIIIQNPITCNELIQLQLMSNDDFCLVNCEAVIRFKTKFSFTIPNIAGSNFNFNFIERKGNLKNLDIQLCEDVDYVEQIDNYTCSNYSIYANGTQYCAAYQNDPYNITITKRTCGDFWGKTIQSNKDYYLILKGVKDPQANIEWIPTFYSQYLSEWAWWNSSWTRKKQINVTSSATITNYSMLFYITYDSDMNSDFSDLRFVDSSETNELPYWIENKSNSNYAYVWVKMNLTSGTNTIYMYYGNPSAISKSELEKTFIIADNFDDNYISNYTWTIRKTESDIVEEVSQVLHTKSGGSWTLAGVKSNTNLNLTENNVFIKINVMTNAVYSNTEPNEISYRSSDASTANWQVFRQHTTSKFVLYTRQAGSWALRWTSTSVIQLNTYYKLEIFFNTSHIKVYVYDSSGSYLEESPWVAFDINNSYLFYLTSGTTNDEAKYDNVTIRKYISPSPSYVFGSEEAIQSGSINILSPINTTYYINNIQANYSLSLLFDTSATCWRFLNGNVEYDGVIANNTIVNHTYSDLTTNTYNFTVTCYLPSVGLNITNSTFFTIITGLNLSIKDYYNDSALQNFNVSYSNGTINGQMSCSTSCILNSSVVSGTTTLTITKTNYKTNTITYTISTSQLENYTVGLIIFDKFWLKDNITNNYIPGWTMNITNGSNSVSYSASGYYIQIAHDELLRGNIDIRTKRNGYTDNTTTIFVNDTTYYNLTLIVSSVNLTVFCKSEVNATDILCDFTITNLTASVNATNRSNATWYISTFPSGFLYINVKSASYGEYTERTYFLTLAGNESMNLTAYLLPTSSATLYTMFVKQEGIGISNATISFYKFLNDKYVLIGQAISDSSGLFTIYLNHVTQYRVIIEYANGIYYYLIYPTDGYVFSIPVSIGDIQEIIARSGVRYYTSVVNKVATCNISNPNLVVTKLNLNATLLNKTLLCHQDGVGEMINLTCDLSGYNDVISIMCYAEIPYTSTYVWMIYKDVFDWTERAISQQIDKLTISFFLIGTITISLLFINPVFGIIGLMLGLVVTYIMQFINISIVTLTGIVLAGGIILYLVVRR